MNPIDVFIARPVATWMLMLSLIVFGVLGYNQLGVDQYPEMEFPNVIVTSLMEGASPEVMEQDVTDVLEERINSIAGVRTISSISRQGVSVISVQFEQETDLEVAAQDVRDKVAAARSGLPKDVEPPSVTKQNFGDFAIMWIPLNSDRSAVETSEYVRLNLKPKLETIPGVASIEMFGRKSRNIRVWLDGDELRARGLAAIDVLNAIRREHVQIPGGKIESSQVEYAVKTDAEFETVRELAGLVVAHQDGAPVYLRDVGRIEDGAEDDQSRAHYDGKPAVGMGLHKQSGANTVAIADEAFVRIDDMAKTLPPGMSFKDKEGIADFSTAIRESVEETQFALIFGALLATFTVWVFLRRTRPTLIVGAAIPISLVASFGFMWLFGFTLNTMTLLALALAVGVVIDDAIVVLENIERHREMGEEPTEAASKGARQIAFAATAATVSIAVVFLPVVFVQGLVGNFLGDFGMTVAAAVMVSLVVALTLTPMLAARMPPPKERSHGSVYHRLEQGFLWLERQYKTLLEWTLGHKLVTAALAVASLFATAFLFQGIGKEFMPPSDSGKFFVMMETPPGTSLDQTENRLKVVEEWVMEQPEVVGMFSAVGIARGNGHGETNAAIGFVILRSQHERERSSMDLSVAARERFRTIPGLKARVFDPSNMMSMGGRGEGEFEMEIKGNIPLEQLDRLSDRILQQLAARRGFVDLDKSLKMGLPEVLVKPDREKAAALGVDATTLATTVQAMIGGLDVATFKEAGNRYDIRVRLDPENRDTPESIERLYVRARNGDVVELKNLVEVQTGASPSAITRIDRERSVGIYANLQGIEMAAAMAAVEEIADATLPEDVSYRFTGQAQAMEEGNAQMGLAFLLAILVIYMVLAAQFESLIHPVTVMLALPFAMVGALAGLRLAGMTVNLFSMIGIILLMGLVTKNSILLVDYANHLRAEGLDKVEAMRRAAPVRMRPVLMTGISMIFGVLPAALGVGPGAETRAPMGVATAAGMLSSMVLTLLVVPVFYIGLDDLVEWLKAAPRRLLARSSRSAPATEGT